MTENELLTSIKLSACNFFWETADPETGLINDRAGNFRQDDYQVASIASTGYGLAALPIAVANGWNTYRDAYERAKKTLFFIHDKMPHKRGWYFHFVDKKTGARVWQSEVSSIDTALLIIGAIACGQFFENTEVQQLANSIYRRVNWQWMLTNNGEQLDKLVLSHGWKPESGFIKYNWDSYCELMLLYIPGMGAEEAPLPAHCWEAWKRPIIEYKGHTTLAGGAIFIHQMAHGFYNFNNQCDSLGWNYHNTSVEATLINREYCIDNMHRSKTYGHDVWGINACDYPGGYKAFAAPGDEDGTVSPTGAVASVIFTPELSIRAGAVMHQKYGDKIWGRFGFSNAFNIDQNWYDPDVIGIDLGMALVNLENAATGLIWKLVASHPSTAKGWKKAGFPS